MEQNKNTSDIKTSVCGILDFRIQCSRPFAFLLLLLQSQYPDLLLLFNHSKDVMVIWKLHFSQIDEFMFFSEYLANRIVKQITLSSLFPPSQSASPSGPFLLSDQAATVCPIIEALSVLAIIYDSRRGKYLKLYILFYFPLIKESSSSVFCY